QPRFSRAWSSDVCYYDLCLRLLFIYYPFKQLTRINSIFMINRFKQNLDDPIALQLSANDGIILIAGVISDKFIFLLMQGMEGFSQSITLQAATAYGPGDISIFIYKHSRSGSSIRRPFNVHHSSQDTIQILVFQKLILGYNGIGFSHTIVFFNPFTVSEISFTEKFISSMFVSLPRLIRKEDSARSLLIPIAFKTWEALSILELQAEPLEMARLFNFLSKWVPSIFSKDTLVVFGRRSQFSELIIALSIFLRSFSSLFLNFRILADSTSI